MKTRVRPLIIGLTGGIASGKSTVRREFSRLGAVGLDADGIARQIVRPDTATGKKIARLFGPGVVRSRRAFNRRALGSRVFAHRELRLALERITHPAIMAELRRRIRTLSQRTKVAVVIVEVPLLYEIKAETMFDAVIVAWSSVAVRKARLRARDGFTAAEGSRRIAAQMPLARKRRMADHVIRTDGTLGDTRRQVRQLMCRLTTPAK